MSATSKEQDFGEPKPRTDADVLKTKEELHQVVSTVDCVTEPSQGGSTSFGTDPVLNSKIQLVNQAINEIGWTGYHWKLFFLNGFGYAVDSFATLLQSFIAMQAYVEFGATGYRTALTLAVFIGMITGAIVWGLSSDIIGRRFAFNVALILCSAATTVSGAMPSWPSLAFLYSLVGFGAGGGLVLDTTIFLEYLPSKHRWVVSVLPCWWGVGQTISSLIAWGFLTQPQWNCTSVATCTYDNNKGWRYVLYTGGSLVFVLCVLRLTVVRLQETPKFLLAANEDLKVIENLQSMAKKYNRPFSLTFEQLDACGVVSTSHRKKRFSIGEILVHIRGLFVTKTMGLSTVLIWSKWTIIGLAYPLFFVFLPTYLAARGAQFGTSVYETWRDYVLAAFCGIFGPLAAGFLCNVRLLGRRYTMAIGALLTMAFLFAFTAVRTPVQNTALTCAISVVSNVYYAPLFAYTPEVLPTAHRTTGYGIAVSLNKMMGVVCAVVGAATNPSSSVPIYVCASLFTVLAALSALLPFEPQRMDYT